MSEQNADAVIVTLSNGINGTASFEYGSTGASLDIIEDKRLSYNKGTRSFILNVSVNGVKLSASYVSSKDVTSLANDYKLERKYRAIPAEGERPESTMTWNEFMDIFENNFNLSEFGIESFAYLDEERDYDFLEELDSDLIETGIPDIDDLESYNGPISITSENALGEAVKNDTVFISNKVDEPTIVFPHGKKSAVAAIVIPSISYQWNDALRWWTYDEEYSYAIGFSAFHTENNEIVCDEILPAVNVTTFSEQADNELVQHVLSVHESDDFSADNS